jgi:hypothetical protein
MVPLFEALSEEIGGFFVFAAEFGVRNSYTANHLIYIRI